LAQGAEAVAGTLLARAMFDLDLLQWGVTPRGGPGAWIAETVAAFGLLGTILGCLAARAEAPPCAVGLYIGAGYRFTASTSFANPRGGLGALFHPRLHRRRARRRAGLRSGPDGRRAAGAWLVRRAVRGIGTRAGPAIELRPIAPPQASCSATAYGPFREVRF
jgi:hypothetical protein